ncbi:MAG: histidinol dehydrogenase [Desulfovibrionaceae bacterium]|nr:histidinol dehydrogenase [Desulfovibrionaceae bacterium]MBF0514797.1 histidinol dehydrogenase [Desulfovibrionaceae bacterium]
MMCREFSYQAPADFEPLAALLGRRRTTDADIEARVAAIMADVAARGDEALADYTRKFDCPGFSAEGLAVPASDIEAAFAALPRADLAIVEEAAANIEDFHRAQLQRSWWTAKDDGTILGQLVRPVDVAGLYVPGGQGGQTPLISSLLMNAIPAKVAGVGRIVAVSPPRADGTQSPYILAAARIAGVTEIYRAGSAWAIAALVHGTRTVPAVDVIAGPGNIYVTTAKRLAAATTGIDMLAGPSEIAILADAGANPEFIAADMLSQAEHDPLAACVLIAADPSLPGKVTAALDRQLATLERSEIARKALCDFGAIVVADTLAQGIDCVNRMAPEHLELAVADPWALLGTIRHAGAIFMGQHCPEPVGDYFAGPNHVLPTMGTARFSSALSVETFQKKSSLIATNQAYVQKHGAKIARLARLEGLEAHARSVEQRLIR